MIPRKKLALLETVFDILISIFAVRRQRIETLETIWIWRQRIVAVRIGINSQRRALGRKDVWTKWYHAAIQTGACTIRRFEVVS